MKCRAILLRAQEQRKNTIEEYEAFLKKSFDFTGTYESKAGKIESAGLFSFTGVPITPLQQLVKKRHCCLILEFPFQTDILSLNRMRVESFQSNIPSNFRSLEEWTGQHFRTGSIYDDMMRGSHIHNLFISIWPKIADNFEFDGQEVHITSSIEANIEDFIFDKVKEDLLYAIDKLPVADSTKKTYKSHAHEMFKYCLYACLGEHISLTA